MPIAGGGRVVVSEGVVKAEVELELVLLMEELKEKGCGSGVSNVENLKKTTCFSHVKQNKKMLFLLE